MFYILAIRSAASTFGYAEAFLKERTGEEKKFNTKEEAEQYLEGRDKKLNPKNVHYEIKEK